MGYGWTHSYNIFLFNQRGHMFLMDGRGRIEKYKLGPGGTFITGPGYFDKLVQTSSTTFAVTTKEKTVFTFALVPNTPFFVGGGPVYRLTSIVDRNNNVTTLIYSNGNLTSITDTYGRSLLLGYNGQNKLISITDPLLRTTTLVYDSTGRQLLKITDPENKFIQYSYNLLYQLTGKVDKDGRLFSYLYVNREPVAIQDGAGANLFSLTNPQNWATDFNALALNILRVYIPTTTSQTDGRGNVWTHDYESHGYITRVIAPDGATTIYSYDPVTLMLASKTDANSHITSYEYDALGNLTKITDALGHITRYTYEPVFSQLTSMIDPNGRVTTYQYDSRGNRTREIDPLGQTREWTYDSHGNVLTEKDKNNNITSHVYDSSGNRIITTDALNNVTTFTYDAVGNRTSRRDANNHTVLYEYDGLNRLVRESDPLGKLTQTFYDGMGNRTKVIDRNGNSTSYEYDLRQRLVKTTDALGQMTTETYDGNNNRISMADKNGHTTIFAYDVQNRLTRITDALTNNTTRTYDPVGNALTETDANNHTSVYEYDALNRRTKMTDSVAEVTRYEYDIAGLIGCTECTGPTLGSSLIAKQTDGNGKVTYFKYDGLDRMILMIRKEGDTGDIIDSSDAVTRYTYDANSNRLTLTEPNTNTATFVYDALDRVVKQTNAAGDTTTYTYDGVGNVISRTDPNTNVTTNTYDALDRLIQVGDRVGRVAGYTYDNVGNRLSQVDGNLNTIGYEYDAIYRVVKVTDPLGEKTQYQYDPVGNLLKVIDRNGNITIHVFDAINRRTSMTDALSHSTLYAYDGVGNLLKITDAKPTPGITQYQYDGVNRLIKETYPDSTPNMRIFTYDFVGNLKTRTDQKGQITTYNYNDLYFLLKRDYPISADDNMTYDLSGRMLTAEKAGWLVTFNYDGANRVTQTRQNGKTVNYVYDIPGRTRTLTYPGGRSITEQMDFRDRKTQIDDAASPPIVRYTYDLGNRVLSRLYRNGTVASYTYNANDWVLSLEHTLGASRVVGFGYAYDKEGNKRFEEKRHDVTHSESYQYDNIYRLVDYKVGQLVGSTVPVPVTQTSYDLDPVGNWNSKTTDTVTETRTHNAVNEITSINATPITHDDNGNLQEDQNYRYVYDEENRLTSVTRRIDNFVVGQYQYDALSRRIVRIANPFGVPTETHYFYDRARIIEEQSATGVTRATYVYGNYIDEVLTMDRGAQTFYYHQNTLFSTYALTNAAGIIVEGYQYDAYGRATVFTGPGSDGVWFTGDEPQAAFSAVGNPFTFTGRELDAETGLMHFRARTYDTAKGRFTQRDPIGYADGMNLYNGYFVPNNVDPQGTSLSECLRDCCLSSDPECILKCLKEVFGPPPKPQPKPPPKLPFLPKPQPKLFPKLPELPGYPRSEPGGSDTESGVRIIFGPVGPDPRRGTGAALDVPLWRF
jgi:RHS repeat-associated protein